MTLQDILDFLKRLFGGARPTDPSDAPPPRSAPHQPPASPEPAPPPAGTTMGSTGSAADRLKDLAAGGQSAPDPAPIPEPPPSPSLPPVAPPEHAPIDETPPARPEQPPAPPTSALAASVGAIVTARLAAQDIRLGCIDHDVPKAKCDAYADAVKDITSVDQNVLRRASEKFVPATLPANDKVISVKQVQDALKLLGFFPGGEIDGICGYRTRAAMRLFQEYVRTVDGESGVSADGIYGSTTHRHLVRWIENGFRPDWGGSPYEAGDWLSLLAAAKQKHLAQPNKFDVRVNAFTGKTDTRKVADWITHGEDAIHLIGIRREEFNNEYYDDVFVLIIKGLVFKFQGTTTTTIVGDEPGGIPLIVPGQHDYQFGWHQKKYLALRPASFETGHGVLVARTGTDGRLSDAELAQYELQSNGTINIHYGGLGKTMAIDTARNQWSLGCQVINASFYISPRDKMEQGGAISPNGAYTLLSDLVTALSGDMPTNIVTYTLLDTDDLKLSSSCASMLNDARDRLAREIGLA